MLKGGLKGVTLGLSFGVAVKIMVLFGDLSVIRHLVFRGPRKGSIILRTTHIP